MMDIYTKIFLINIILIFSALFIDKQFLDDYIDKQRSTRIPAGAWALMTLLSIPAWLIYLVAAHL